MQVVLINETDRQVKGVKIDAIPASEDDLRAVVEVLSGQHEDSNEVLRDVVPGSIPDDMGAKKIIYLVFEKVPNSDHPSGGGVYAVQEWVSNVLDPAMPEGWGAAMTQPAMFPLVANADNDGTYDSAGHFQWLGARQHGEETADLVVISPMERAVTGPVTGMVAF